jgi:hypothetical protein
MFKLSFNRQALVGQIEALDEKVKAAVRPAAQAGADVVYQAVRARAGQTKGGSGRLRAAIYQKFIPESSQPGAKATYYISWRRGGRKNITAGGLATAPHGNLIEYGFWQRYVMVKNAQGQFIGPAVRTNMQGKPKPKRSASQATKDAYYVPLPGGPIWHPPQSFLRASADSLPRAMEAAKAKFQELVK